MDLSNSHSLPLSSHIKQYLSHNLKFKIINDYHKYSTFSINIEIYLIQLFDTQSISSVVPVVLFAPLYKTTHAR